MRRILAALLCLLLSGPAWAGDCPLDLGHGTGIVIFSDRYMLALRPEPMRVEVGQPFSLLMNVCTKDGEPAELVDVEVTLDEGAHADTPRVLPEDNGRYRVEGLMLPTPGSWELAFDVRTGDGKVERLTHDIVLK
ncbi:MAG: hypothetical protein JSS04_15835 [Proteobacteria bacterium]|nr:hypothetical protein [Pseudomonadota bacterium]